MREKQWDLFLWIPFGFWDHGQKRQSFSCNLGCINLNLRFLHQKKDPTSLFRLFSITPGLSGDLSWQTLAWWILIVFFEAPKTAIPLLRPPPTHHSLLWGRSHPFRTGSWTRLNYPVKPGYPWYFHGPKNAVMFLPWGPWEALTFDERNSVCWRALEKSFQNEMKSQKVY